MDEFGPAKTIGNDICSVTKEDVQLKETKEYELNFNKDTFLLTIELLSNEKISFKIRQINNISFIYFYKEYSFNDLNKYLLLPIQHYDDISKIFKFYDTAVLKNKVTLLQDKDKKSMVLLLKITLFFDDIESKLYLDEIQLTNEQMLKILFNEIREIKTKGLPKGNNGNNNNTKEDENNKNNDINKLVKKNEEMELKINELETKINIIKEENNKEKKEMESTIKKLIDENKKMKDNLNKYIDFLEERMKELKKEKKLKQKMKEENDNYIKQNIKAEFKENPQNLKLREELTNIASCCCQQSKFAVFIGLKDHIEYLVFNNKNTFNLDIMRIKDKTIITSLKGHTTNVIGIRYYIKDNKEEYLLSWDTNKLVIVWDIQNYYNKKYTIQTKFSGHIFDALLLFNIFNNNYILLSNSGQNEYSKLYEFKENTQFVRNIYGTNDHTTYFMIPWLYQNKYYIIECSNSKISINNLLLDESYANLNLDPEGYHYCGYLYQDNYLCVCDYSNNSIRIWDLVKKVIYKQINYQSSCAYELIPWNNNFSIVGSDNCFVVINIEEGKMVKKVDLKGEIRGIKKIKLGQLGECLISSDSNYTIQLFSL